MGADSCGRCSKRRKIKWNFSKALNRIGMNRNIPGKRDYLGYGLDGSNFIIGVHHADQSNMPAFGLDNFCERIQINQSMGQNRNKDDNRTFVLFEPLNRLQRRWVFKGGNHDHIAREIFLNRFPIESLDCEVVGLCTASGKNDLTRGAINKRRDLLSSFLHLFADRSPSRMEAGSVAKFIDLFRKCFKCLR